MSNNKFFISWSKKKSRNLAMVTKKFLEKVLGDSIEYFFSPESYKGTCVDNEIHKNLLSCTKCLVCITADNFKNPWLLYEAGVIYGSNFQKASGGIVIPILFEDIPDWSSWIDKPLNRYVPIQMQNSNHEFNVGKKDFKNFLDQIAIEFNIKVKQFNTHWAVYEKEIQSILNEEELIPSECKYLVNTLLENDNGSFTLSSPEINKEHIVFHKGFTTHALTKILTDSVMRDHGKYLWLYGRKNKKILSREYDDFFNYLASEGIANGVDFRCLFPMPNSEATIKASSKDRLKIFNQELQISLGMALDLKAKYNLPVEKLFKLYSEPRREAIVRCDNSVIYRPIVCDAEGYPIPYTNSSFEIFSGLYKPEHGNKGAKLIDKYDKIWNDISTVPLTVELFDSIYS